jgi:hypothetical protein
MLMPSLASFFAWAVHLRQWVPVSGRYHSKYWIKVGFCMKTLLSLLNKNYSKE